MPVSLEPSEAGPWNYWGGSGDGEDVEREGNSEWTVLEVFAVSVSYSQQYTTQTGVL